MTRKAWLLAAAVMATGGAAVVGLTRESVSPSAQTARADKPALALLTSLPLMFGEQFGLANGGSAALSALERRYTVRPIGVADAASLRPYRLLLMAHPRAQPAEALVELDQWVRGGGRLLLLADPRLDWPSERPPGDRLRPPPAFADTGLLRHWGLELVGPSPEGPATVGSGGPNMMASSPGQLVGERCELAAAGFIARCRIGKGSVTVIADADFLNVDGKEGMDGPADASLGLLMGELARLESP